MHITLEADYAVRIVNCLSKAQSRMDAKAISEATGVTLRFSLKILRKLVAAGLVKSYKGTHGGYELAKEPKDLTLYDVIHTVEGPYELSRCISPDFNCTQKGEQNCVCRFNKVYSDISNMVIERLKAVTFDAE